MADGSLKSSPNFLYEFGPFQLDVAGARLLRDGAVVPLSPKSFEVLTLLVRQAGALVDKEMLMREVWPDTFVEEANLARHVWTARQALGADSYIETVPKRGYRFVGHVRTVPAPMDANARTLIVLPFRLLRPDAELDFLTFSLPDAIASALSSIGVLQIRSSLVAARFAGDPPDFDRITREADVNTVVAGTILRAGDRVRVTTQLIEAPTGTLHSTASSDASTRDLFQLQDELVNTIVERLAAPLSARDAIALRRDVPADAQAYEWYLRANRVAHRPPDFTTALDLYVKCVDADPKFAPAWARLGRLYRVIGKYHGTPEPHLHLASEAFGRALALNPDLSIAHNHSAYLDADLGRAVDAMVRLRKRAGQQHREAELFAGLVHVCRYAGLLDASVAAHRRAMQLDPLVATSVVQSYWMRGDTELALAEASKLAGGSLRAMVLSLAGRQAEAIDDLKAQEAKLPFFIRQFSIALRTLLEGNRDACLTAIAHVLDARFSDGEGLYFVGRYLARLGETDRACTIIASAIDHGFNPFRFMEWDPWLDSLRGTAAFATATAAAKRRYEEAEAAYENL